jgi:hypothetical protein
MLPQSELCRSGKKLSDLLGIPLAPINGGDRS